MIHLDEEALKNKPGRIRELLKQIFESADMAVYNKSRGYLDFKTLTAGIFIFYGIKKLLKVPGLPKGATLLWWASRLLSDEKRK